MNTSLVTDPQPRITARFAGILMLMTIAGGVFAQGYVSNRLLSFTNAATTANNILANRSLFTLSYTVYLIEMASQIASTALIYLLMSPVNRGVALVAAFLDLSGAIFKTFARVFYITPLFLLSTTDVLSAFNSGQLRALALVLFRINDRGAGMALAFFGVSGLLNGYLIYRSTFLPRWMGVLSMVCAVGWLRWAYPPLRFPPFTVIAVLALIGAAIKIFWLIVYGVDEEKWRARYGMTSQEDRSEETR
jgi:hypothetical protein